jgi:hypothetical protein
MSNYKLTKNGATYSVNELFSGFVIDPFSTNIPSNYEYVYKNSGIIGRQNGGDVNQSPVGYKVGGIDLILEAKFNDASNVLISIPSWCNTIKVILIGGGGGGGGGNNDLYMLKKGGGGGGGGLTYKTIVVTSEMRNNGLRLTFGTGGAGIPISGGSVDGGDGSFTALYQYNSANAIATASGGKGGNGGFFEDGAGGAGGAGDTAPGSTGGSGSNNNGGFRSNQNLPTDISNNFFYGVGGKGCVTDGTASGGRNANNGYNGNNGYGRVYFFL